MAEILEHPGARRPAPPREESECEGVAAQPSHAMMFDNTDSGLDDRLASDCQAADLAFMACWYIEDNGASREGIGALTRLLAGLRDRLRERFEEIVGEPYIRSS